MVHAHASSAEDCGINLPGGEERKRMRNLLIVEAASTGYNYAEDAFRRGFNPVVLEIRDDDTEGTAELRRKSYAGFYRPVQILKEPETYAETLALVRNLDPVLIVAGSEDGVGLCTRLSDDLGLLGNAAENIGAMTRKDEMHLALKKAGIRYIPGEKVASPEEAAAFCRRMGFSRAVVKPLQSAGSQGLFLCDSVEEVASAVATLLTMKDEYGRPIHEALVQQRIVGTEYIVNTVSSEGVHRMNSILRYRKQETAEGGFVYDYIEFITKLEAGHGRLIEYALQVADAIGFRNGIVHGEYMVDEDGPVLIEVNCRPMGCTMPAEYLDLILGQHETDTTLDSLLSHEWFLKKFEKPYRPLRKAYLKLIIIPKDMDAEDHPIWEVARHLRSTWKIDARNSDGVVQYFKTRDLETNGGVIYMVHDDERVVEQDLEILETLEKKYFGLLINDGTSRKWFENGEEPAIDYAALLRECGCSGSILVAADQPAEIPGTQCVTPATLPDAHKGFDYVLITYRKSIVQASESELLRLMFDTMSLVRRGGKVIIPEFSYRYLSYEREGAEMLMRIVGLTLEAFVPGKTRRVTGTM